MEYKFLSLNLHPHTPHCNTLSFARCYICDCKLCNECVLMKGMGM